MGKSEKRKSKNGPQAAANASKSVNEACQVRQQLQMDNMHDYLTHDIDSAEFMLCEEEFPCLPETPSKPPAIKQRKTESADTTAILSQIGELSRLINNRSDALEKMPLGWFWPIITVYSSSQDTEDTHLAVCTPVVIQLRIWRPKDQGEGEDEEEMGEEGEDNEMGEEGEEIEEEMEEEGEENEMGE
ncbi:unnamed protein product [Leuciscus chuanchicus]